MAVCCSVQLLAQQPHPRAPLEDLLRQHGHARPAPADAQPTPEAIFDVTNLGSPAILDKGWRVGITANPAAASPDFDDSTWALRDAQESFADVPDEDHPANAPDWEARPGKNGLANYPKNHHRPFAWFRLHLKLAPNHDPVFLLIELPPALSGAGGSESFNIDVFANGRQIQPEGPHGDAAGRYQQISRIYPLNLAPSDTSLVLAIRSEYIPLGWGAYTTFFSHRKLYLGHWQDLDRILELWSDHNLFERLPRLVNSILLMVMVLFLLALYYTQKGHPEYLWLALYELAQVPIGFLDLAGSTAHLDHLWAQTVVLQLLTLSAYLYFEFLVAFLSLRKRWSVRLLRYSAPILAGIAPLLLYTGRGSLYGIALAVVFIGSSIWTVCWLLFIFITLIRATLRRNFEAGLLFIPLLLSFVAWIEALFMTGMSNFAGTNFRSPLSIQLGPIPIHFGSIADFTGILVIVIIIFGRFLRIQHDQERAASELAAARSVQELMIPQEKLATPGFEVDSVYNPANEVGGDFYHLQTTGDGGLLVVIGDVAGKGLKAAMNVSMLMGALRRTPEKSPARLLESLNRVLTGSESFTTCQAALFGADGTLVLASAGHLPPYLNSQEVVLPGGLPLGVLHEVSYEEVRLYLHPGDRILLLSDGVVEARRPTGELFGFDRVHNLSNQSAFYIADAAREFGQEDDITVLTVRRLAQAMAA
jgi:hypothetical protein